MLVFTESGLFYGQTKSKTCHCHQEVSEMHRIEAKPPWHFVTILGACGGDAFVYYKTKH
jgi:hypothetical protein